MTTEIRVPALGESVTEATIGKWLKAAGEAVAADEPVVELETDKVSVEVPAPAAGVIANIAAEEGDTVEVGALLGAIEAGGAAASPAPESEAKPEVESEVESKAGPAAAPQATAAPEAAASGGGEDVEVRVPEGGESVTEADVGELLKKVGDSVAVDEPIVSLETDKAAMDVPAPAAGVIKEIAVNEGDTVEVGALLAIISAGAAPAVKTNGATAPAPAAAPAAAAASSDLSPAPRRVVAERGLDPSAISGTGKDGRITKGDALAASSTPAARAPDAPAAPRDPGPREERVDRKSVV